MPIDPNIALGVKPIQLESPLNQLAQVMQITGLQNQNRMADMQFQQKEQADEEARNVNALYSQYTGADGKVDRAGLLQAAARNRLGSRIPEWQKQFAESDKAQAAMEKDKAALVDAKIKQSRQLLDGVSTPEQLIAWHEGNHTDPVLGEFLKQRGITAQQSREKIMQALQTPGGLERLINESKLGAEKFIELNKPQYQSVNTGNAMSIVALPGLGGAPQTVREAPILQSEQSKAEIASREREAARNRDVTMRGQDLTDRRVRESNEIARDKKAAAGVKLSPTEQKELFEADDTVQSGVGAISSLKKALELNNKAYSGVGAGTRATIVSNLPGQSEAADATIALDNIIMDQALSQMKAIFGGNPTEGERAILLDLQASASKTPTQRKAILDRAIASTQRRVEFSKKKADDLRTGRYMQPGGGPSAKQDSAMNPQDAQALEWANANPNDPRAAQIKQRLGQ